MRSDRAFDALVCRSFTHVNSHFGNIAFSAVSLTVGNLFRMLR